MKDKLESLCNSVYSSGTYKRLQKDAEPFLTESQMLKFLKFSEFDVQKALTMIEESLIWRFETYKPHEISPEEVEEYAKFGMSQVSPRGNDAQGRSILIVDRSKHNFTMKDPVLKHSETIKFAMFSTELACKKMGKDVEGYVMFMNLSDFTLSKRMEKKTSRELMKLMAEHYPDAMDVAIVYKPPWVFKQIWNVMKLFMDKSSRERFIFVSGDFKDGSKNDLKLKSILGDNWKHLTGVEMPRKDKNSAPGYDHESYWKTVVDFMGTK